MKYSCLWRIRVFPGGSEGNNLRTCMGRMQYIHISSVQSLSCAQLFATQWTAVPRLPCSSPTPGAYSNSCPLHWWCHPTILCRPLLLLHSIFPSIRVFSNESTLLIRWPKYWSFSFSISPSNEHPELISFRMDWLDLLTVQGTLKSLLQHHSSKASSLALSFLPSPTLTSIRDYWKNHNLD